MPRWDQSTTAINGGMHARSDSIQDIIPALSRHVTSRGALNASTANIETGCNTGSACGLSLAKPKQPRRVLAAMERDARAA
jgi:hypothetical protein